MKTTIKISKEIKNELAEIGNKDSTFESIICYLLDIYKKKHIPSLIKSSKKENVSAPCVNTPTPTKNISGLGGYPEHIKEGDKYGTRNNNM